MAVLTAANQLTLLRLLLVPVFVLFMLYDMPGWALVTFAVGSATDAFDGLLARRLGQPTTLGAWLDPMADKLLVAAMLVMLTIPGFGQVNRLPVWLTVLVLSRDIAIVITVAIVNLAGRRQTFRPTFLGKAATAAYLVTGVVTLFANYLRARLTLVQWGVYISLGLTLASATQYVFRVARELAKGDDDTLRN
jgi:cardiolipin synthase